MPWIILQANGEELQRLVLERAVTIGRSPECELSVRDILLSRAHCRIEPVGANGAWRMVDLGSKNGTRVGWQKMSTHVLRDGDWLRMGRTRLTFHVGPFEPAAVAPKSRADRLVRPADPHEAMTGTVTDFVLLDEDEPRNDEDGVGWGAAGSSPFPQPRPVDPTSGFEPSSGNVLEQLAETVAASSRGEDVEGLEFLPEQGGTATLAKPKVKRMRALPKVSPLYREISVIRREEADLSLQAEAAYLPAVKVVVEKKVSRKRKALVMGGMVLALVGMTVAMGFGAWALTMMP